MNRSRKRPIVFAVRDFPPGCGTKSDVSQFESRATDYVVKNPRINHDSVKDSEAALSDHFHVAAARKREGPSCFRQVPETKSYDPSPREKVLEVLRHFNEVFKQLDLDKRRGTGDPFDATNRIDIKTQNVLEKMGKLVNTEKRIGYVPGIEVGDEFQYKTELRVVGLHFKTMCGIDYMKIGETKFATSIVASEGYGYNDKFDSDVVVYTGEGGNVLGKDKKADDQKMVKGNLALANSMKGRSEVRVIRGEERWDRKGKRYVYDGLYLVDNYWLERGASGKSVYKFRLCRIPGQPPLTR